MTNTAAPAARVFGRCPERGCPTRVVLDPATDARVAVDPHGIATIAAPPRTLVGGAIVGALGTVLCATPHATSVGATLLPLRWAGVRATLNRTECDARCQDSRSEVCKCSCGGARHGETA